MRWVGSNPQPSRLCLCLYLPSNSKNRHFDRSCSQFHREQRSGEIRFSTPTVSKSQPRTCRCLSSPHKPKARHFDRSCSQFYREQRSGEIRFSTSTVLQSPSAFAFALVVVLGTKRSALTFTKNTTQKEGLQRVPKSLFCLKARLQPCRNTLLATRLQPLRYALCCVRHFFRTLFSPGPSLRETPTPPSQSPGP